MVSFCLFYIITVVVIDQITLIAVSLCVREQDPVERSRRLWVISRINGTALRQGLERHDFDVLSAFAAPTLPLGSGRHRVAFLLYQHKDGTPLVASRMNDRKRGNFNPQRWALEHHLDLEGFTFFTVNANT